MSLRQADVPKRARPGRRGIRRPRLVGGLKGGMDRSDIVVGFSERRAHDQRSSSRAWPTTGSTSTPDRTASAGQGGAAAGRQAAPALFRRFPFRDLRPASRARFPAGGPLPRAAGRPNRRLSSASLRACRSAASASHRSLHLKRIQLHPDGLEFPEAFAPLRQLGLDMRQEVRDLGQATVAESSSRSGRNSLRRGPCGHSSHGLDVDHQPGLVGQGKSRRFAIVVSAARTRRDQPARTRA